MPAGPAASRWRRVLAQLTMGSSLALTTFAVWELTLGRSRVSNPLSRARVVLNPDSDLSELPTAVSTASREDEFVRVMGPKLETSPAALAELCLLARSSPAVLHMTVSLLQHLESDPQHAVQLLLSLPLAFWSTLFEQGPAQLPAGVAQVRTAFLQRLLTIIDDSTWGAPLAGARAQDIRARALAVGGGQLAAAWRASVPRSLRRGFSTHPKLVEQMQGQYTAAMHPLRDRRYLLQCIAASADQGDAAAVAVQCAQLTDNVLQGTLGLTGWQVQASVEALCGALQALLQQTGLASVAGDVDEAVRAACCAMLALTQAPAPPSTSLHAAAMAGAAWMQASAQALLGRAPPPWLTSLTTTPTLSECLRPPSAASLVTALAQRCADRLQA
ncbi:unnamed protein product, partial [Symbiodinium sp. KB8]